MRPLGEVIQLPILSRSGNYLGAVEELVLDNKRIAGIGFLVRDKDWYRGVKFLSKDEIEVIGKNTIITTKDTLKNVVELPDILEFLDNRVEWRELPVYTDTGEILGKIEELFINEETLDIEGIKIKEKDQIIPRENLVALGPSAALVNIKGENMLKEEISVQREQAFIEEKGFKAKQNAFLIGKKLIRDLVMDDGTLIASKGDVVTIQIINQMRSLDRIQELINSIEE
ncbi:MAG: PRC-barrel domain-containing protein [bacterium]